jgi:hypothetical protein
MKSILRGLINAINAFLVDSKVLRPPLVLAAAPRRALKDAARRANDSPPAKPY